MTPPGELICPSCQILLPDGARRCVRCGTEGVGPAQYSGLLEIDAPLLMYREIKRYLGPLSLWASIGIGVLLVGVAAILFMVLW
jgi:hypothetical protein